MITHNSSRGSETSRLEPARDATFLKIALGGHRKQIVAALSRSHFTRSVHLELDIVGVPAIRTVALFAWPLPPRRPLLMALDIVRLNTHVLDEPIRLEYKLSARDAPAVIEEPAERILAGEPVRVVDSPYGSIQWYAVGSAGHEREALRFERDGSLIVGTVNTKSFPFRMACPECGRFRYAKANSLHQVFLCRVCTRQDQLRRRALAQYRARKGR